MSLQTENSLPNKKVLIETWGCQMNTADSEKMLAMLKKENYQATTEAEGSDLIILNTCHIRENARHKVVSRLGVLRELKKENPNLKIAVTGCVAQAEGKKLLKEAPVIDVLVGPGKVEDLGSLLKEHDKEGEKAKQKISIGFRKPDEVRELSQKNKDATPTQVSDGKNSVSRFVNIQQGCNNFCTFCVVPFTRGREVSEHPDLIVENTLKMATAGAKEITLLGQNVNSYGLDLAEKGLITPSESGPFYDILKRVAELDEVERLRFTTSNPHDFTQPLAQLFKDQPKLGRYIHLPVQSGSDSILESMKRKVTVEEYWERVKWLRDAVPDMAISTDIIVGFPGETEEDFMATYNLVKELRYSFIFAFKYSQRKGTAAPRFKDQVPEEVKSERLNKLNALQNEITTELNKAEIGKTREILFLYESMKEKGVYYGRTPHFRLVKVAANRDLIGKTLDVKITAGNKTALVGELI
jgi:tRNA-2-methylthio-N6-dimethylallyladenosine synthase